MPPIVGTATRKSHTKSRKGCATCKRRHIRCDETRPQCKNCTKHHVKCDFMESPGPKEEPSQVSKGLNLLSSPAIEAEIENWRTSGVFPFPEMQLQTFDEFQGLSRIELRLVHHLCTIYREMRLADFVECTVWVQLIPSFLHATSGHSFAMSSILAFSATHMAWITKSVETNNLAYHHRGIALKGLHTAIGNFCEDNSDAVLAASILLLWQASDWASWKSLIAGTSTVIGTMSGWKHLSRFSSFIGSHASFFSGGAYTFCYDEQSVPLATNSLRELSARLQNVHPVARQVKGILEFANDFRSWSTSLQIEQLFEKLQPLRAWLFWLPVNLVKNNDMSSTAMVLLAHLHTLAIAIDASLPELNGAALGCLTVQATNHIDLKLRAKMTSPLPGEMQPAELDNLMSFPRLMSAREQLQDGHRADGSHMVTSVAQAPFGLPHFGAGSRSGTPNYPPPASPALSGVIPALASQSFEDLSFPPSPFLHYSNPTSRRNSQYLAASPAPSEHSFDNRSLSGYSHQGESPAYSPAAFSPVYLPDMPDEEAWSFGRSTPNLSTPNLLAVDDTFTNPEDSSAQNRHSWFS